MKKYTIAYEELYYAEIEAESEEKAWEMFENDDYEPEYRERTHTELIETKEI